MIQIFVVVKNDYFFRTLQPVLLMGHQIKVVKICRQIEEAFQLFKENETDIVLMDINWNRHPISGLDFLKQLLEYRADLRVIGFTNSFEQDIADKWKAAGGRAYIYRSVDDANDIATCIKSVKKGEHYYASRKHV